MSKPEWLYGIHTIAAVLAKHPDRVLEIKLQESRDDKRLLDIARLAQQAGIPCQRVGKQQLDHQLPDANHQGVAARCKLSQPLDEHQLQDIIERKQGPILLLVLDSVTDPHNLGACLRSADAAGVDAVVTTRDKSAGLTPVVRRVAVGAAEVVPFVQVTNLARTLQQLQELGVWLIGTELDAKAKSLYDTDLRGSVAIVMGAEGTGLRRLTRETCDQLAYIPMQGDVQSLNVSVATGICLFEAVRQRLVNTP